MDVVDEITDVCPAQMVDGVAPNVITGILLTITVAVCGTLIHELVLPVTVYTVVEAGVTVLVFPEPDGNQV